VPAVSVASKSQSFRTVAADPGRAPFLPGFQRARPATAWASTTGPNIVSKVFGYRHGTRSRRELDSGERDPARLVVFTDAVIAIAVTLLVLDIRAPQDTRHLLHGLAALWPSYLSYVITFMLIGQVWANHHVMFDHIRHADRLVLFLNTVLLMDIALLPFAAGVLANSFRDGQGERTAVVVHGIAFDVAAVLFNVI
jgi:uncharacterized membrane protein